jgi:hypothetical protein
MLRARRGAKDRETIMNPFNRMSTEPESLKTAERELSNVRESVGHLLIGARKAGAGSRISTNRSAKVFAAFGELDGRA